MLIALRNLQTICLEQCLAIESPMEIKLANQKYETTLRIDIRLSQRDINILPAKWAFGLIKPQRVTGNSNT